MVQVPPRLPRRGRAPSREPWSSVENEKGEDGLNLDPNQARQATTKKSDSDRAVNLRLAETYQWVLVPTQPDPLGPIAWDKIKVDGQAGLAVRASKKLANEAHLYTQFAPSLLRQRLDGQLASLWEPGHVAVGKLWDAFARYLYLPRLRDQSVLVMSVGSGAATMAWQTEGFATADTVDEASGRYLGLSAGGLTNPIATTLVAAPSVAMKQLDAAERAAATPAPGPDEGSVASGGASAQREESPAPPPSGPTKPTRFHAAADLDPERLNRDFGKISAEVIAHLTSLLGSDVTITVEITASNADGFPDQTVRNVTENSKTLKFSDYGFEDR